MKLFLNYFVVKQFRDECGHSSRRKREMNYKVNLSFLYFRVTKTAFGGMSYEMGIGGKFGSGGSEVKDGGSIKGEGNIFKF
jgi:hypothetical protein